MFRLSSWISESRGCDKVINGEVDHKMADATPAVVEIGTGRESGSEVAKRKRSVAEELLEVNEEGQYDSKRRKFNEEVSHESMSNGNRDNMVGENPRTTVASRQIRDTIESQFSLEILLKHDELRLINQELAKCQAAMEQLRRCHLIPYPTSQGNPESMMSISNGVGPALKQGDIIPRWAPAYGVSDGPYTKHYSMWLIPDYSFDGIRDELRGFPEGSRASKSALDGRSTRNSFGGDGSTPASKSRSQRGSTGQKLQALSSGYPQAKEKAGPCIAKRGDHWVKLVCIDCQRDNFSSVQGFINHCRIAHRREFKSHEEAANTSGQPIELDEMGSIVGEEKTQPSDGLVHPLIRSAPTGREAYRSLLSHINQSLELFGQGRLPGVTSIPTCPAQTPLASAGQLVPSPDTPHLSNLMQRRGLGGNLPDMVGEATTLVEFDESEESDNDSQTDRPLGGLDGADSPLPAMRMPARAPISAASFGRPGSSKGVEASLARKPGMSPRITSTPSISSITPPNHVKPSPLLVNSHHEDFHYQLDREAEAEMMGHSLVDLSPHTVASNSAPSLVSDDGEFDEGDDAESVSSEAEDEDSDVAEIDIEDGEGEKVVTRTVLRNRSGSGGDSMRMKKEDKHVTFVSPVKEAKVKGGRLRK